MFVDRTLSFYTIEYNIFYNMHTTGVVKPTNKFQYFITTYAAHLVVVIKLLLD